MPSIESPLKSGRVGGGEFDVHAASVKVDATVRARLESIWFHLDSSREPIRDWAIRRTSGRGGTGSNSTAQLPCRCDWGWATPLPPNIGKVVAILAGELSCRHLKRELGEPAANPRASRHCCLSSPSRWPSSFSISRRIDLSLAAGQSSSEGPLHHGLRGREFQFWRERPEDP